MQCCRLQVFQSRAIKLNITYFKIDRFPFERHPLDRGEKGSRLDKAHDKSTANGNRMRGEMSVDDIVPHRADQ